MKYNTTPENIHLIGNASLDIANGIDMLIEVAKQYENTFEICGYVEMLEFYKKALDKIESRICNNLKYIDRQS